VTIDERYQWACETPSDINSLVPTLLRYGKECGHITEFGVRTGVSTSAWLMARPKELVLYDIGDYPAEIILLALKEGIRITSIQADTSHVSIEPTDLLFVDTVHNGDHVLHEIAKNHEQVRKYLIFHDTLTYGDVGESGGRGIISALNEFLVAHPEWRIREQINESNGLTVLERQ
jgi:hypothetical protein